MMIVMVLSVMLCSSMRCSTLSKLEPKMARTRVTTDDDSGDGYDHEDNHDNNDYVWWE